LIPVLLAVAHPTFASSADAGKALRTRQRELGTLLAQPAGEARDRGVERVCDAIFDYGDFAKESLSRHWAGLSPEEQKQFRDLLTRLIRNAMRRGLSQAKDYQVSFRDPSARDGHVVVPAVLKHKNPRKTTPSLDFVMHRVDNRWLVHDVVIDGSSLVGNYRSQFGRVLKKQGFAELLRRMQRKLQKDG
jgi:phospholipid transport system substrate-binding protein